MTGFPEEYAKSLTKELETQVKEVRDAAEKQLAKDLSEVRLRFEQQIAERFRDIGDRIKWIGITAVSVIAAAVVLGMYTERKSVNESVIALQQDILSAQTVIRDASRELQSAKAELTSTQADLRIAQKELADTKGQYEQLIRGAKR